MGVVKGCCFSGSDLRACPSIAGAAAVGVGRSCGGLIRLPPGARPETPGPPDPGGDRHELPLAVAARSTWRFMDRDDPGVQLFTSRDGGDTWSLPFTMNGGLSYMDKPILVISPSGRDVYVAFNHKFDNMVVASPRLRSLVPPAPEGEWGPPVVVRERWDVRPERRRVLRPRRREDPSGHGHDFDGPLEVALLRCSPRRRCRARTPRSPPSGSRLRHCPVRSTGATRTTSPRPAR
jgi:hypothetical protein